MAKQQGSASRPPRKSAPATTVEGRENQMIALAMDLAEKRMRNGTASAQEVTHFLKLGTQNARIERDILEGNRELVKAKTDQIRASQRVDELYAKAISAMHRYNGEPEEDLSGERNDRYED